MYALPVTRSIADLAARIKAEHEAISESVRDSVARAIVAGELLIEAKAQLDHGQWLPWLRTHCGMTARTAQTYMELARICRCAVPCCTCANSTNAKGGPRSGNGRDCDGLNSSAMTQS
jgi:hypothetical protein